MLFSGEGEVYVDSEASLEAWTGSAWVGWDKLSPVEMEGLRNDPPIESQFLRVRTLTFRMHLTEQQFLPGFGPDKMLFCTGLGPYCFEAYIDAPPVNIRAGDSILCAAFSEHPNALLLLKPLNNLGSRTLPSTSEGTTIYERIGSLLTSDTSYLPDIKGGHVQIAGLRQEATHDFCSRIRSKWRHHFGCGDASEESHDLEGQIETFLLR